MHVKVKLRLFVLCVVSLQSQLFSLSRISLLTTLDVIFVLADAPGGGGRFCGGGDGAVLHPARLCRGEEEEAARHPAGSYGQIFPSPHTQTGRLHTHIYI